MANAEMIKAVQACRRKVTGLAEEATWREFLKTTAGKDSLRAMDGAELGRVLDELHRRGAPKMAKFRAPSEKPWARKIFVLWRSLDLIGELPDASPAALRGFVDRQTGVADPDWLTPAQSSSVIEALKDRIVRAGVAELTPEFIERVAKSRRQAFMVNASNGLLHKMLLIEALWQKLHDAGAFKLQMAHVGTWLRRFGVAAVDFLSDESADKAITALGTWLKRTRAAKTSEAAS